VKRRAASSTKLERLMTGLSPRRMRGNASMAATEAGTSRKKDRGSPAVSLRAQAKPRANASGTKETKEIEELKKRIQ
jgi:anti-sigma28 factor (negative regulator of flagellin synthesis)